jgi:hypothetical protein
MERKPIESTAIRAAGYDPDTRVLEVEFQSGAIYEYQGVPVELYEGLIASDSAGRYFEVSIRDAGFVFRRVS